MNIRREIFNKKKQRIWLIRLKEDKYLHIPKPKTVIKYFSMMIKEILLIPAALIMGIYEAIVDILEDLSRSDILVYFSYCFPNVVNVIDEGSQYVEDRKMLEDE